MIRPMPALCLLLLAAAAAASGQQASLPYLKRNGAVTQLMVVDEPFLMLAGELHNSSASSVAYMEPIWPKLAALHLNTAIGTVSWELLEPQEGRFDFTLADAQIQAARKHNLRLILIWFGTWKNAGSSYAPMWVNKDPKRFPLDDTASGKRASFMGIPFDRALSPLGEATVVADAKAFRMLMRHIRQVDPQHTVIMMQVENETGILGDSRDHSPLANAAWAKPVPAELLRYLESNKANLLPEVSHVWGAHGFRGSGTWAEVFGSDEWADQIFQAWHIGRFVERVIEAGKAELNLPMYVNAWLGPQPGATKPGQWPSGGPVSGMMDIWRAAAPKVDLFAPDIYVADFQGVCGEYTRSGNPLFIPEARASAPNLFWAVGRHAALGYSPFGIEDLKEDHPLGGAYAVLGNLAPVLAKYQAEGKVAVVVEGAERQTKVTLGGYRMNVRFGGLRSFFAPAGSSEKQKDLPPAPVDGSPPQPEQDKRSYGLIVATGPDEFLIVGSGLVITFEEDAHIGTVDEGRFEKGKWIAGRRLNGDESFSGVFVAVSEKAVESRRVTVYRRE